MVRERVNPGRVTATVGDGSGRGAEGRRVLVVDDDASVRRFLQDLLAWSCDVVIGCGSVAEALAVVSTAEFDVAVVDLRLGNATGADLVRALRQRGRDLPVVILTGSDADPDDALDAGAVAVVRKPVKPTEFETLVLGLCRVH